ncbi:MAG: DUF3631 domain-containing protein, partial [Planctomycetota bacterium]
AVDRAEGAGELLRWRDDLADRADAAGAADPTAGEPPELDADAVVRPDGFVLPDAAGFVIGRVIQTVAGPRGLNTLHAVTASGSRVVSEVATDGPAAGRLDLPGRSPLYVHPVPTAPTPADARNLAGGWSGNGRRAWRAGSADPCPAEMLDRVRGRFIRYLALPAADRDGLSRTLAAWTVATYVASAFNAVPYLHLNGPAGSGKSRAADLLRRMAFRPLFTSSVTGPALFRTLHSRGGTLLLDEAERLGNPRDPAAAELLAMLLAGYKAGGRATRLEPVGETFRPVGFEVFGFKALAGIAGLPAALASRCVRVGMIRADPDAPEPRRNPEDDPDGWAGLRDDLHALALAAGPSIRAAAADPPDAGLSNRDRELWTPLLAVAAVCEAAGAAGEVAALAAYAARSAADAGADATPDADVMLLECLHRLLLTGFDPPQPSDVLRAAREAEPGMFDRWTARGVGARLKGYGLTIRKSHGRRVYRDLTPDDVAAAAARYGVDLAGVDDPDPADAPPADPWGDADGGPF